MYRYPNTEHYLNAMQAVRPGRSQAPAGGRGRARSTSQVRGASQSRGRSSSVMSRGSVVSNVSRAGSQYSRANSQYSRASSRPNSRATGSRRRLPRVSVHHPVLDQARDMKSILQKLLAKPSVVLAADAEGFVSTLRFGEFVKHMRILVDDYRDPESELGQYVMDPEDLPPILSFFFGTNHALVYQPSVWSSYESSKYLPIVCNVYEGTDYTEKYDKKEILLAFLFVYTEVEKWLSNLLTNGKRRQIRRNQYEQRLEGMEKSTGIEKGTDETDAAYVARVAEAALGGQENILNTKSIRQLVVPVMLTQIKDKIAGKTPEEVSMIVAGMVHSSAMKYFVHPTRSLSINRSKSKGYLARMKRRDEDGNSVATEDELDLTDAEHARRGTGHEVPRRVHRPSGMGSKAGVSFDASPQFVSMRFQ